ncbi:MAG TPA: low molecular weight protein-tyrosine-phosphatase [Longimicrobium sp.]|nr:low molecular weight protein-tyrosine-phosphatase [Longimicrobium sp.]
MPHPIRILFVCMGNICRSPLAEAVFRHQAAARGLSECFAVDSAGISGYHQGDPPDRRSAETARRRGVRLTGRSRRITAEDLEKFDYVIAMDTENLDGIRQMEARAGGGARVHLLREWDPDPGDGDVPDPYYGGARGFEDVHDIVDRATAGLLDHLVREHHLA